MTRWIAPLALLALASACQPESVKVVVLTPSTPEIAEALRAADARWEAAGVDPDRIQIGPGGAPVRLVPERGNTSQTNTVGHGHAFSGVTSMDLNCLDAGMVLHEVGHALGIKYHRDADAAADPAGVEACAPDAANRPLMCSHVGHEISADDLAEACAAGACDQFSPEL
jgi:hypothetical protein